MIALVKGGGGGSAKVALGCGMKSIGKCFILDDRNRIAVKYDDVMSEGRICMHLFIYFYFFGLAAV